MFMYMLTQAATLNQVDYRSDIISDICLKSIILYCMCRWSSLIYYVLFPLSHLLQPLHNHGKGQR